MSLLLWTSESEAIDLGNPFLLYGALAEIAEAGDYEAIQAIPDLAEQQVTTEQLSTIREQARAALSTGGDLSAHAHWVLEQLEGEDEDGTP